MDAFELLRRDHERTLGMFPKMINAAGEMRATKLKELREVVEIHTRIEEDVFYPALRHHSETRDRITDAESDHDAARRSLARLEELPRDSDHWRREAEQLRMLLERHMNMEEHELFPAARRLLTEDQQNDLEARLMSEQQTLRVLYHPGKPGHELR